MRANFMAMSMAIQSTISNETIENNVFFLARQGTGIGLHDYRLTKGYKYNKKLILKYLPTLRKLYIQNASQLVSIFSATDSVLEEKDNTFHYKFIGER